MNKDLDRSLKTRIGKDYNNPTEEMIRRRLGTLNMEVPCENSVKVLKQLKKIN